MSSDYDIRRQRADHDYATAYAEWVATLTPAQRHDLMLKGVEACELGRMAPVKTDDRRGSGDAPELPEASYVPDIAGGVEGEAGELADLLAINVATAKRVLAWHRKRVENEAQAYRAFLFQRLIAGFLMPGNLRVRAGALAFAADLAALNGMSTIRAFAKSIGMSPFGVSKVVTYWRELLDLPANRHSKTREARAAYSRAQHEKHWRIKKC